MSEAICFLHEIDSLGAVGGKARGLTKLIAAGLPVPAGFVAMPDATDGEIVAAYRRLGAGPVAVRSSAEEEDSQTRSYAGQFDTFLDVSGEGQVVQAVKACRASASSLRVTSYREDEADASARICVIIQRMVHPDYAGVGFAEPGGSTLVEGVAGLGDRLVSGRASPAPLPDDVRGRVSPPPPRLLAELADGRLVPFAPEPEGDALLGCGASPGRATGRARVVRDFGEIHTLEPGEILVTRTTDIGWTPLFRLASAVVTEIGAPTSHAAIVARELGLPAVVNVDRVTERIRTGNLLFVDGWAGLVRPVYEGSPSTKSPWAGAMSGKADESRCR